MAIISFIHSTDIWTSMLWDSKLSAGDAEDKDIDPAPKEFVL